MCISSLLSPVYFQSVVFPTASTAKAEEKIVTEKSGDTVPPVTTTTSKKDSVDPEGIEHEVAVTGQCRNTKLPPLITVSHSCPNKHKTLFLKIELNALSYRGHFYGHFEKKRLF